MNYEEGLENLYSNRRKIGEATEDIEVKEGETVSQVSIRRKEKEREDAVLEVALDTAFQFVETVIDIAESLDMMRINQENA